MFCPLIRQTCDKSIDGFSSAPWKAGMWTNGVTCNVVLSVTRVLGNVTGTKLLLKANIYTGNCN